MVGSLLIDVVFLVILPVALGSAVSKWAGDAAKRRGISPAQVRGILIATTTAWAAVVVYGLAVVIGPVSFLSTLTLSAIGGLVVTLALQTTLQNLVAGFLLLGRRFVRVGDLVEIGGMKGTVAAFGLVTTVLRREDGSLFFVSNSTLMAGPMVNHTAGERLKGEY
jgi:small conductance mechanosensitive channel